MPEAAPSRAEALEMKELAKQERLASIGKKLGELFKATKDENMWSGMSEAEREASKAKAKEEIAALAAEYRRVALEEIEEPDWSDMSDAERAAEADRLRRRALQEARRLELEGDPYFWMQELAAAAVDFDPKQDGMYYSRYYLADTPTFDVDEESPLGPMRFTNTVYEKSFPVCQALNILSVKIACSDVGFPIRVYGTVIARDSIDHKCLYLFRRDRDHCQLINSKDEPLILTGPKRGLVLFDDSYVETDLKIKDHEGRDREFSKGVFKINGVARGSTTICEVARETIDTRLSTVDVLYAVVKRAVEATIGVRVLRGKFNGIITAHTTSIQKRIVLYDSKAAGADTLPNGVIQLMRSVVSVHVRDMLIIEAKTHGGDIVCIEFPPRGNKGERVVSTLGAIKMRVKVAWSVMDP